MYKKQNKQVGAKSEGNVAKPLRLALASLLIQMERKISDQELALQMFDAYNESGNFIEIVERYRERNGHYPIRALVDKIYRTCENKAEKYKPDGNRLDDSGVEHRTDCAIFSQPFL
jgi:hypothetical protein